MRLQITKDGSHTIHVSSMNVTYHSLHGALQESMHVFIEAGLHFQLRDRNNLAILEMGFGTGLNALLSLIAAVENKKQVHYTAVELFPIPSSIASQLNYPSLLGNEELKTPFMALHNCDWGREVNISPYFTLQKLNVSLPDMPPGKFDLVYFDAFAPAAQPELWTRQVFRMMYENMNQKAVLVTYCAKGEVRRAMQSSGFIVDKLPGPSGKREMMRARKP